MTSRIPGMGPRLASDAVVVSLAPVLTLARLSEMLGGFGRLVRVLPNAPSLVGAGFNPVAFADDLDLRWRPYNPSSAGPPASRKASSACSRACSARRRTAAKPGCGRIGAIQGWRASASQAG